MEIAEANVVGIFIRTFFYGIYVLLMAHGLRWIFFEDEGWQLRPRINKPILAVIVLVFLFTTGSLAFWITLTLSAVRGTLLLPNQYIVASVTLENVTTLAIDAVLIFRCWVVSNRSWPAMSFPLVLWFVNIGFFATYIYKTAINGIDRGVPIILGFYSCNIGINLYVASAVIYQILRVARRRPGGSVSDLYEICHIIIECGLPYLFSTIFSLSVIAIGTELFLFPTSCALYSTMNAIAFHLLVIRVGLRRADGKRNDRRISTSSLRFNAVTRDPLEDQPAAYSDKRIQEAV